MEKFSTNFMYLPADSARVKECQREDGEDSKKETGKMGKW